MVQLANHRERSFYKRGDQNIVQFASYTERSFEKRGYQNIVQLVTIARDPSRGEAARSSFSLWSVVLQASDAPQKMCRWCIATA